MKIADEFGRSLKQQQDNTAHQRQFYGIHRRSVSVLETSGSAWDPPVYPIKLALVGGVVLLLLQGTAKFIRDLHFAIKGNRL